MRVRDEDGTERGSIGISQVSAGLLESSSLNDFDV